MITELRERTDLACHRQGVTAAWFYSDTTADQRHAKAVCATCPARQQCLTVALTRRERHGIWGGTTWHERQRLIDQPNPPPGRPRTSQAGENNGNAKITHAIAAEIRRVHATGIGYKTLSRRYGLHHSTIARIVRGEKWQPTR